MPKVEAGPVKHEKPGEEVIEIHFGRRRQWEIALGCPDGCSAGVPVSNRSR